MRLTAVAAALTIFAVVGLALPADAAPKKTTQTVDARGNTVFTSRDEDGKTRTRIIIQKRSYLDPGTETLPGERMSATPATSSRRPSTPAGRDRQHRRRQKRRAPARPVHAAGQEQSLDRITSAG